MIGLTQKQENFTQNLFKGLTQRESWIQAGYSSKYAPALVDIHACAMAGTDKIKIRLAELRDAVASKNIADKQERQEILTRIVRATVPDFITEEGIKVEKGSPNVNAVSEITSRTKMHRGQPVNIVSLKLLNKIQAADILNKMDKVYSEVPALNDNRTINIIVSSEKAKELTDNIGKSFLLEGEDATE